MLSRVKVMMTTGGWRGEVGVEGRKLGPGVSTTTQRQHRNILQSVSQRSDMMDQSIKHSRDIHDGLSLMTGIQHIPHSPLCIFSDD